MNEQVEFEEGNPPKVNGAPERIWLVYGELDEEVHHDKCDEVAWCTSPAFETDVEYVRKDLAEAPRVHLTREETRALSREIGPGGMFEDTEIEVGYFEECQSADGEGMLPAGMYVLAAEYPEEGRMPLFERGEDAG